MSKLAWQHGALFIYIYTYIFFQRFIGLLAYSLHVRACVCRHFSSNLAYTIWLDSGFGFAFFVFLCFGFGPGASEIVSRLQLLAKYFFFLHEIFYLSNPKTKKKYEKKLKKRNETKKCQAKSSSRAIKPLTATTENKIYD